MSLIATTGASDSLPETAQRATKLFHEDYGHVLRRADRLFAGLMVFQWAAAVAAAMIFSPRAWAGTTSSIHVHVWSAVLLGGCIAFLPITLALTHPGRTLTRHVIAVGQMLTSALFIHLGAGRIEMHFHVFGSLAFLAFYRDWRVLTTATVVVALDHMLRGYFWPRSVYGVNGGAEWRWLEHAGWVVFENAFLMLSCAQGIKEMKAIALRQAEIETKNIELAETTRRAEAAAEAKGQFLANMSHEIRTPLNGVIGMTELLGHTALDSRQHKYTSLIRSSANALLSLINDILDFSKIEAGKFELDCTEFDPRTVVEEVAELLSPRAAEKQLELLCRVSPDVPTWVQGDPGRLRQVLLNLAANAVKFTDRGDVIIQADGVPDSEGFIRFSVTDTGIGIPPDRRDRLFKKFSQVDGSNTRRHGGTGLGLAISKELTELMGGQIGVSSVLGTGSTFWTEIPFKILDASQVPRADAAALSGLRVLIVDDNATNREILAEQCTGWGFETVLAEDGPDALRLVGGGSNFDLVILDMQMPGMTGLDVARRLRTLPGFLTTPLLVLSSIDGFGEATEGTGLVNGRLVKPARQSDLFNTIVRLVSRAAPKETAGIVPVPLPSQRKALVAVLAEDNSVNQLVAVEMLKSLNVASHVAPDGQRALDLVRQGGVDLVLMDCQMPVLDGFEATRQLRELERSGPSGPGNPPRLPVIALTANAIKGDRERCLASGMDGYVSKPIDRNELAQAIDAAVSGSDQPMSAVATEEASHEPAIVYPELLRRCMGNTEIVVAVLDALIADCTERFAALETAAADERREDLARIAHALKGAAANASAEGVRRLARSIEAGAGTASALEIGTLLTSLRSEIDRCTDCAQQLKVLATGTQEWRGVT